MFNGMQFVLLEQKSHVIFAHSIEQRIKFIVSEEKSLGTPIKRVKCTREANKMMSLSSIMMITIAIV